MMADDDNDELFRETYTHLNSHQQDMATRWLDMGNNTLLYRCVCRHFAIDLPLCQTIHKIDLTFMVTLTVHKHIQLNPLGSLHII